MRILLFLCLSFNYAFAAPFTEGGKAVPKDDKYKYFIRIETASGSSCSATKVAKDKIITAAHCVVDDELYMKFDIGEPLLNYGNIKSIDINPNYIDAQEIYISNQQKIVAIQKRASTMTRPQKIILGKSKEYIDLKKSITHNHQKISESDIAFITIDKNFKETEFPKIISKGTKFSQRGKMEFVGYGATKKSWSDDASNYVLLDGINEKGSLGLACWKIPPKSYKVNELSSEVIGILKFDAKITHSIKKNEDFQTRSQSMFMPGDSGASAIELDSNKNQIITGIGSAIKDSSTGEMKFKVKSKDGKETSITLDKPAKGWGDPQKNDLDFIEIVNKLEELGLYKNGKIQEGIEVSREYERETSASFADLLHPDNQSFINEVMN